MIKPQELSDLERNILAYVYFERSLLSSSRVNKIDVEGVIAHFKNLGYTQEDVEEAVNELLTHNILQRTKYGHLEVTLDTYRKYVTLFRDKVRRLLNFLKSLLKLSTDKITRREFVSLYLEHKLYLYWDYPDDLMLLGIGYRDGDYIFLNESIIKEIIHGLELYK